MADTALNPSLTAPTVRKSLYIPSLDGIRAVSFMLVFIAHCGLEGIVPGGLGVTIFFFLSGYLITTLLRTEADQTGRINIRDFYIRRVLRIFPPFYITILFGVLLHVTKVLPGPIGGGVLFQSFHLANYWTVYRLLHFLPLDGIPMGSNVMWSLAVEEHFYLLFPVLYVVLRRYFRARGQTILLSWMCLAVLAWRCFLVFHLGYSESRTFYATDTRADSILWGCIFAIVANPMLDEKRVLGYRLGLLFFGAVLLLVGTLFNRNNQFRETFRYTIHGLILFPIFTAAIVYHESPMFRWLNFKWVRQFGVLSYSLYLIHYTILYVVWLWVPSINRRVDPTIQGVIAFIISLGLSIAMYRWVEKPFAQLRKKFSHASGAKSSNGLNQNTGSSQTSDGLMVPTLS